MITLRLMERVLGITFMVSLLKLLLLTESLFVVITVSHSSDLISLAQTVMDLAQGHVISLAALEKPETFAKSGSAGTGFGGSGGKYKAYNLGKGKGMSVMEMVAAMKRASGFDYKYEVVGRR